MECDGCFDLDETFVLNSENDSLELENMNILMPLFEETALLDTEAVHVIIETQTNETENSEFETEHLEIDQALDKLSEGSLDDTESINDNETDNASQSRSEETTVTRSRRPLENPELWKQNIRERKRNAGGDYTSCKGEKVRRRNLKGAWSRF